MAKQNREIFQGLKVADFGLAIAAPVICGYLGSHGATVVHVETGKRPDVIRIQAPYKDGKPGVNRSGYFAYPNSNKYSLALDLDLPRAREVARKLIAWADVAVDNFRVGPMEKWGLDYENLKKIKPDIIMLRTTNQGLTGPHSRQAGWGWQLVGLTGISNISGWPDREPLSFGTPYTDVIAPRFGVTALVAALIHRRRTGKGQLIDLSQMETSVHFIAPALLNYFANGEETQRTGNSSSKAIPQGVYRCQGEDRWCAISVTSDHEWRQLCRVMGNPAWTKDSKFTTAINRKKNEKELNELIERWTVTHTAEEVMGWLQAAGVAAGVVATVKDLYEDRQLNYRKYFWHMEHPELGLFGHMGPAFSLSKTPAKPRMPAPCLGEHSEYVCRQFLGMSDDEIIELFKEGVFE